MPVSITFETRALDDMIKRAGRVKPELVQRAISSFLPLRLAEFAPVDSGALKRSLEWRTGGPEVSGVWANFYGELINRGTGIYGPHGSPIVPVRARFLHFFLKDGTEVSARSVKGVKPMKWVQAGLEDPNTQAAIAEALSAAGAKIVRMIVKGEGEGEGS